MAEHDAIQIPTATLTRMEQIITQRNQLDEQLQLIVATLRDALSVPDNYQIGDIRRGFVPSEKDTAPNV